MLEQILEFIKTNSAQIRGGIAHRTILVLVLAYNQRVFDLSVLSNEECMLVIRELSRIEHLKRTTSNAEGLR